jgi:hypothetical protein
MYYICIVACTHHSHPEHANIDQAYIGCWMERDTEEEAIEDAKTMILEEPWVIEEVESVSVVTAEEYDDDPENLAYDIVQDEVGESGEPTGNELNADATLWVSNETVVSEEESPEEIDMMDEEFWSEARVARALEIAKAVVENEGWKVNDTVKHWPFSYRHLDKQPDLTEYVDGAEEDGVSLVIWDKNGEEEEVGEGTEEDE